MTAYRKTSLIQTLPLIEKYIFHKIDTKLCIALVYRKKNTYSYANLPSYYNFKF